MRPKKQAEMRSGPEDEPGMSYEARNRASFDPDRAAEMRLEAARKAMGKAGYMGIENAPAKGADDGTRPDPFAGARPKAADAPSPPRERYHSSPQTDPRSMRDRIRSTLNPYGLPVAERGGGSRIVGEHIGNSVRGTLKNRGIDRDKPEGGTDRAEPAKPIGAAMGARFGTQGRVIQDLDGERARQFEEMVMEHMRSRYGDQ